MRSISRAVWSVLICLKYPSSRSSANCPRTTEWAHFLATSSSAIWRSDAYKIARSAALLKKATRGVDCPMPVKRGGSEDPWRKFWTYMTRTTRIETNYIELRSKNCAQFISDVSYKFYAASSWTSRIDENRSSVFRRRSGKCGWFPNESDDSFFTLWIWIV
jgi:hypothetical protein